MSRATLGHVEVGQHLDAGDDGRAKVEVQPLLILKRAVDAKADARVVGLLFDVHIRGVEQEGPLQDLVGQAHHRCVARDILQPFSVVQPRRRGCCSGI
ncbi:hypothetical protein D3C85_1033730 [compost metagenome]